MMRAPITAATRQCASKPLRWGPRERGWRAPSSSTSATTAELARPRVPRGPRPPTPWPRLRASVGDCRTMRGPQVEWWFHGRPFGQFRSTESQGPTGPNVSSLQGGRRRHGRDQRAAPGVAIRRSSVGLRAGGVPLDEDVAHGRVGLKVRPTPESSAPSAAQCTRMRDAGCRVLMVRAEKSVGAVRRGELGVDGRVPQPSVVVPASYSE